MSGNLENEMVGQTLSDRYIVKRFLGRGGMAEVYEVWDQYRASSLAMKLLHADLAEDIVFIRRFKREAQTLSRLQHPNIVRLYGWAEENEKVYLLMSLVEGDTLRREIARTRTPMDGKTILWIMQGVCSALHYAHKAGIIHCDIKSANIMFERTGQVMVTDFGIARMAEGATTTTMVGAGTPAYMSPEQIKGEDPTPQMDIYSLGVVLYEMLTGGERPFTGDIATVTGSTGEKVRWEHLKMKPPSPRKYNPSITPQLEAVVFKCLEKDPKKRYSGAIDLLDDLQAALAGDGYLADAQAVAPIVSHELFEDQPEPAVSQSSPGKPDGKGKKKQIVAALIILAGFIITGFLINQNRQRISLEETAQYHGFLTEESGKTRTHEAYLQQTIVYKTQVAQAVSSTQEYLDSQMQTQEFKIGLTQTSISYAETQSAILNAQNTAAAVAYKTNAAATAIKKASFYTSTPVPKAQPSCTHWSDITSSRLGSNVCVYGGIGEGIRDGAKYIITYSQDYSHNFWIKKDIVACDRDKCYLIFNNGAKAVGNGNSIVPFKFGECWAFSGELVRGRGSNYTLADGTITFEKVDYCD